MIEYIIIAVGSVIAFIAQYVYVLGKLTAKMQNCEKNVEWIRDFLISRCGDSTHFTQQSAIKINNELKEAIPVDWKDTLLSARIDTKKCLSAFDCVVKISNDLGLLRMKKRAKDLNIPYEVFLLASGVYLFDKKDIKNG